MKILVTGSNGTIGTRLCETLLERGYDVVGVDRNARAWKPEVGMVTINLDLTDQGRVMAELPKDVDCIVHLAANPRVHDLVVKPELAHENMTTTFNVLEFARQSGIKRIIFSSSRETYGNRPGHVNMEGDVDIRYCPSPYTAGKIADEALFWAYQRCYGLDFIIFRFSNVYGMYDDSERLIPLFQRLAIKDLPLTVFGREKLLDFTYIDDTVHGVILGIDQFEKAKNDVYNLSSGEGVHIFEAAEAIKARLGSHSEILLKEPRVGEVIKHIADITKIRNVLGYQPTMPFAQGLEKTIRWYQVHPETLALAPMAAVV